MNPKFYSSISLTEDSTVCKQGGEATIEKNKAQPDASPAVKTKSENNAYSPPTTVTESTKSVSNNVVKLKSKSKMSKLHLPEKFKVKKISEHFKPLLDTKESES